MNERMSIFQAKLTMLRVAFVPCSCEWLKRGALCPVVLSHFPWKSYVMRLMKSRFLFHKQVTLISSSLKCSTWFFNRTWIQLQWW